MLIQFSSPQMVPNAMLTQFSPIRNTQVQHSPNSHLLQLSGVQYSVNFHLIRNHPNNSHPILICAINSHQLEMAGANAHLMLIYNFHQIGENWLRIEWELKFFFAWGTVCIDKYHFYSGWVCRRLYINVNCKWIRGQMKMKKIWSDSYQTQYKQYLTIKN